MKPPIEFWQAGDAIIGSIDFQTLLAATEAGFLYGPDGIEEEVKLENERQGTVRRNEDGI